ncbi:MAG TPA: plastocyanin/azurin family copper-binding protein [Solirubrobacteraceae bacterium]
MLVTASTAAGCGDAGRAAAPPPPAAGGSVGRVAWTAANARGGLVFTRRHLQARAGRVRLVLANPASTGSKHGLAVSGHDVEAVAHPVWPGKTTTVTVRLAPGTYRLWCPVPGHAMAGMRGTLTVR